jgi:hypothetical protein
VRITEELLEWKSSGSGQENRINGHGDPLRWPHDALYPQKLALTSPTIGGRSVGIVRLRTKGHRVQFSLCVCTGFETKNILQSTEFPTLQQKSRQCNYWTVWLLIWHTSRYPLISTSYAHASCHVYVFIYRGSPHSYEVTFLEFAKQNFVMWITISLRRNVIIGCYVPKWLKNVYCLISVYESIKHRVLIKPINQLNSALPTDLNNHFVSNLHI